MAKEVRVPRLLIGAAGSGSGKTTFTCGLLRALMNRGKDPVSFKCGPDYIDPLFHTEVIGAQGRNLDLFFADEARVKTLLSKHGAFYGLAVMEGVMGYYDGLGGISTEASSYDLAKKTSTPAILLVDGRGKSVSIVAEIKGFLEYKEDSQIRGIVLNRVSPMMYPDLKRMIEEALPVTVYGYLPTMKDCALESRHLGLITASEIENLQEIVNTLAEQIEKSVDMDGLLQLAEQADLLPYGGHPGIPGRNRPPGIDGIPVRIGVAVDKAFCFYYADNLDLLAEQGADIVFFSPLKDKRLPKDVDALIFGGGYPELYLETLSNNETMRQEIREAIDRGVPCIAECGGFMYLHERIQEKDGRRFPMVGAIKGESFPTEKLQRFGYVTLTAKEDTLLCKEGDVLKGHEFHYWDSTNPGDAFLAEKPLRKRNWEAIVSKENLFAGYPHLYFTKDVVKHFLRKCRLAKV